jgi:hypothetical protein
MEYCDLSFQKCYHGNSYSNVKNPLDSVEARKEETSLTSISAHIPLEEARPPPKESRENVRVEDSTINVGEVPVTIKVGKDISMEDSVRMSIF